MRFISAGRRCWDIIFLLLLCYATYEIVSYATKNTSPDTGGLAHKLLQSDINLYYQEADDNDIIPLETGGEYIRRMRKHKGKKKEYFKEKRKKEAQHEKVQEIVRPDDEDLESMDVYNCSERRHQNCLDVFPSILLYPNAPCNQLTDLVILLTSRPERSSERQAIRMSWAQNKMIGKGQYRILTLFVIGTDNPTEQQDMKTEDSQESDIILGNFPEDGLYETMALIVGHVWLKRRCADVQNVMKADDVTFVNLEVMLPFIRKHLRHDVIMGNCRDMRNDPDVEYSSSCYTDGHVTTGLTSVAIMNMMRWIPVLPSLDRYLHIVLSKLTPRVRVWDISDAFVSTNSETLHELCMRLIVDKSLAMRPVPMEMMRYLAQHCGPIKPF